MIAAPATANMAVIAKMTSNDGKGDIHDNDGDAIFKLHRHHSGLQLVKFKFNQGPVILKPKSKNSSIARTGWTEVFNRKLCRTIDI